METIKTLRIKLETPMISDADVDKQYDIDSMLKGSHKPDYTLIEKSRMADVVRTMLKYREAFKLSDDQSNVSYDYFIGGMEMCDIEVKRDLTKENVRKLIQRLKNKAYKLLKGQVKKTELARLSKDYNFISDTSL